MRRKRTVPVYFLMFVCVLSLLTGCGGGEESAADRTFFSRGSGSVSRQTEAEEETDHSELYMIQELNMLEETITLTSLADGRQERYGYSLTTKFLDKFGNTSSSMNFTPGNVVSLGEMLPSSKLSSVQMSDEVWKQTDVRRYSVDAERGVLTLGQTKYRLTADTAVFSNEAMVQLQDIGAEDVLQVVGYDRDVISIAVTTGHGYIQLVNTGVFQGSMICVGSRIFAVISGDMTLSVPEGSYDITVANDGYGGTANYTVSRNETTVVDLDTMKGEGPKVCRLSFDISVEGASVYLDGKIVDATQELSVRYGNHKLRVEADGYEKWERTLVVNSPSAQLVLDLADEETSSGGSAGSSNNSAASSNNTSQSGSNNSAGSSNNTSQSGSNNSVGSSNNTSQSNSNNSGNSSNSNGLLSADYLTTLNELISTLILTK